VQGTTLTSRDLFAVRETLGTLRLAEVNDRRSLNDPEGCNNHMLWLILGIILLVIAIAGGAIVHPILFALAIVALFMFVSGYRGRGHAL
jgi:hypothetical protein